MTFLKCSKNLSSVFKVNQIRFSSSLKAQKDIFFVKFSVPQAEF